MNYYPCERDEEESLKLVNEITEQGGVIERYAADVSDEDAVNAMVDAIIEQFGRIDMLVNNAMTAAFASCTELSFEMFMHMMAVNCGGAFLMSRACIPHMLRLGSGSVVMVSSSAFINGGGSSVAYPAAKGGMEGLMRGLVNEYAKHNIRINAVRPSVVETPTNRNRYTDEQWEAYVAKMPMRRAGTPRESADAILYLSDREHASFINGHALNVDGARINHLRP